MKKAPHGLIAGCSILLVLVFLAGLLFEFAGVFLIRRDPLKSSDALVILSGGGDERLQYGAKLYDQGIARRIILTETDDVQSGTNTAMAFVNLDILASSYSIPKARIVIARKTSTSTYEEAQAVKELMVERKWESLVVVTDSFHSRRTGMIFGKIFQGTGIKIRIEPVDVPNYWYNPWKWWLSPESRTATFMEYVKIVYFITGQYEK